MLINSIFKKKCQNAKHKGLVIQLIILEKTHLSYIYIYPSRVPGFTIAVTEIFNVLCCIFCFVYLRSVFCSQCSMYLWIVPSVFQKRIVRNKFDISVFIIIPFLFLKIFLFCYDIQIIYYN